mgnify:CR=1 FL=1
MLRLLLACLATRSEAFGYSTTGRGSSSDGSPTPAPAAAKPVCYTQVESPQEAGSVGQEWFVEQKWFQCNTTVADKDAFDANQIPLMTA